jgi:predicted signal transduction protein with EAL and GGDEF domain
VGDELLIAVGARLTELLRPGDTLARFAGDEFVVLCEDLDRTAQVEPLAARIDSALGKVFDLSGIEVQVSASVGIAFAGRGGDDPEQILQDADTAMYQVKRKGGSRHGTVDVGEQRIAENRTALSRDLRGALSRREFRIEYQPIVATADGRITGVEALLRWAHPVRGIIAPDTVVPLAEQSGLIVEIGHWVLAQACADLQRWQQRDHPELEMCVNISSSQLMVPDFAAMVADVLGETRTHPRRVTLEITESVFIQDSDRTLAVLHDLRRLGLKLALDDFGTGFSSLSYLKQFPVNIVKIDRAFVADLGREPTSRLIVGAIVRLAHSLEMSVVAEGIESEDQYHEVVALECDSYQGYFFARPSSAGALESLMATAASA